MTRQTARMRPLAALLVFLLVAACDSPDRAFWGAEAQRITLDGRVYAVHLRRDATRPQAQVIRLGHARRPDHAAILEAMPRAAELASGCAVIPGSLQGDSGVMTMRLRCPAP